MHRTGLFNADPHPGNWIVMKDGRIAALDFGSCKQISEPRLALLARARLAASARDAAALRLALTELGYLPRGAHVSAQRALDSELAGSWWLLADQEITITADLVRESLAAANDPRSPFRDVLRAGALPADDFMLRRLDMSVLSVLGMLGATRNWHRIALEYWRGDPPGSDLGEADRGFWFRRRLEA